MGRYFEQLKAAMEAVAKHPKTLFIGQATVDKGTAMSSTLVDIPLNKRVELPVAEEFQMGMSIGLAVEGYIPVSIYPRWNFLLCAVNQLVNHLDKLPYMGYNPGVIVRVGVGSIKPLDPQWQHKGDFSEAFALMLRKVRLVTIKDATDAVPYYVEALQLAEGGVSTIVVEYGDSYND